MAAPIGTADVRIRPIATEVCSNGEGGLVSMQMGSWSCAFCDYGPVQIGLELGRAEIGYCPRCGGEHRFITEQEQEEVA